jgi:hypothetical protein
MCGSYKYSYAYFWCSAKIIPFILLLITAFPILAKERNKTKEDFFEMSLEELVEEPFIVVSASRQAQQADELPVPVTVNKASFEINVTASKKANLRISSKLLRIA